MNEPEVVQNYKSKLEQGLKQIISIQDNIEEQWEKGKAVIHAAAEQEFGEMESQRPKTWFEEECQNATENKNIAYRKLQ
ncbi:hypothetical protein ANN_05236 [Periplaneta americana]|uniref:Uncharacterized protein n=1 Tax=Periplaneta americana TaxID=6978 RepID=A0ABQ8TAK3_PERAM|nr:hypothetical protein ANN_05236 [Periplaneta americana]